MWNCKLIEKRISVHGDLRGVRGVSVVSKVSPIKAIKLVNALFTP